MLTRLVLSNQSLLQQTGEPKKPIIEVPLAKEPALSDDIKEAKCDGIPEAEIEDNQEVRIVMPDQTEDCLMDVEVLPTEEEKPNEEDMEIEEIVDNSHKDKEIEIEEEDSDSDIIVEAESEKEQGMEEESEESEEEMEEEVESEIVKEEEHDSRIDTIERRVEKAEQKEILSTTKDNDRSFLQFTEELSTKEIEVFSILSGNEPELKLDIDIAEVAKPPEKDEEEMEVRIQQLVPRQELTPTEIPHTIRNTPQSKPSLVQLTGEDKGSIGMALTTTTNLSSSSDRSTSRSSGMEDSKATDDDYKRKLAERLKKRKEQKMRSRANSELQVA